MDHLPIHIAFCVNDPYLQYVLVTIRSISESHPGQRVHVHIITDSLSAAGRRRLDREVAQLYNIDVSVHEVDDSALDGLQAWSKYTWYRLLIQDTLPADVHRVLYLDADTLVTDDLTELFSMEMDGAAVAGVIDPMTFDAETYRRCGYPADKQYVCAGVLLLNLDYWRSHDLAATMIEWGLQHVDIKFHDQDCINHLCQDTKVLLPLRFGVVDALFCRQQVYQDELLQQARECVDSPAIIHYAGTAPWLKDVAVHPWSPLWHSVNRRMLQPVRRSYKSKGALRWRVMLHDLLHPAFRRVNITMQTIRTRAGLDNPGA